MFEAYFINKFDKNILYLFSVIFLDYKNKKGIFQMNILVSTLLSVCAVSSSFVFSNETNTFSYMGISVQNVNFENVNFTPSLDTNLQEPLKYQEDTSSGMGARIFIGQNFNEFIAIETGFSMLPKSDFKVIEDITKTDGTTEVKVHHKGEFSTLSLDFRAIGSYPITDNIFLRAQLGAYAFDNQFETLTQNVDGLLIVNEKDRGVSLLSGIGFGYGFSKNIAMTLDLENTKVADISTKIISLGIMIRL